MSWVTLAPTRERAGHLVCACDLAPPASAGARVADGAALGSAAAIFALTVLAQALTTTVLPMAGVVLAPNARWAAAPFALTLLGAGVATFPAALLSDVFGRRAALALGASLGLAGGAVAARSLISGQFVGLALGAFWLGVAQGFGYFHRHAPVTAARDRPRAIAIVVGSGALAALAAPGLIAGAQSWGGPLAPAAALAFAGCVEVCVLIVAMTMQPTRDMSAAAPAAPVRAGRFAGATAGGAFAWFAMAALMARAAPNMSLCGIAAASASAIIASHILAMYLPAALLGPFARRFGATKMGFVGLAAILAALFAAARATSAYQFEASMVLAGCGWSLTMIAATLSIHDDGSPSRTALALHDGALFAAAVVGALVANFVL